MNAFPGFACCLPDPDTGVVGGDASLCECPAGYDMNAVTGVCTDRNECVDGLGAGVELLPCDSIPCFNEEGGFTCQCGIGYAEVVETAADGSETRSCVDQDECALRTHDCSG